MISKSDTCHYLSFAILLVIIYLLLVLVTSYRAALHYRVRDHYILCIHTVAVTVAGVVVLIGTRLRQHYSSLSWSAWDSSHIFSIRVYIVILFPSTASSCLSYYIELRSCFKSLPSFSFNNIYVAPILTCLPTSTSPREILLQ